MKPVVPLLVVIGAMLAIAMLFTAGWERPPVDTVQRGYRGTGMVEVYNPRTLATTVAANALPAAQPPATPGGPPVSTVYKNVQVLGDLNIGEFTRLMASMTEWVSPDKGCAYCHAGADFAADTLPTKVIARKMLQMTRKINTDWKSHVGDTGVTCYTCHRGKPEPSYVWHLDPGPPQAKGLAGNRAGQNTPGKMVGLTSLPFDPFSRFLNGKEEIRVASTAALPGGSIGSMQDTEATYALMMHFSEGLGVNCTFCHNTRSFSPWDMSTPQRATAFHGIRMVRDINMGYLDPLKGTWPADTLGPLGDGPKANCATCHQGAYKPLFGASLLKDYPELVRGTATAK
jgi:photosynthetic reaction center cytochrome c subunit